MNDFEFELEPGKHYAVELHLYGRTEAMFVAQEDDLYWFAFQLYTEGSETPSWQLAPVYSHDVVGPWIDLPVVNWPAFPAWCEGVIWWPNNTESKTRSKWFYYVGNQPLRGINSMGREDWLLPVSCEIYYIPDAYQPAPWTGDWQDSLIERPKK
jgi:hypothetical protein